MPNLRCVTPLTLCALLHPGDLQSFLQSLQFESPKKCMEAGLSLLGPPNHLYQYSILVGPVFFRCLKAQFGERFLPLDAFRESWHLQSACQMVFEGCKEPFRETVRLDTGRVLRGQQQFGDAVKETLEAVSGLQGQEVRLLGLAIIRRLQRKDNLGVDGFRDGWKGVAAASVSCS